MIKIDGQKIIVGFAEKQPAEITVSVRENHITLQDIVGLHSVGERVTDDDIKELPKVILEFHCQDSIDCLIEALEASKQNLRIRIQALAC